MPINRYSKLAIASVALNLPWMAFLAWWTWLMFSPDRPPAGGIYVIPLFAIWFLTGIPAGLCGLFAWDNIRCSHGELRGIWIAIIGFLFAASLPLLAAFYY
ncbi:MAG: hypothetical protein K8T89_21825 [Planctomycetes bacterium]|nr:hypothetical protein [Planctomycetota bacterium]